MLAVADRPQNHQRMPIFVDNIYNRLHPIQTDIVFVNQVRTSCTFFYHPTSDHG